jgi:putative flippase GtrA
MKLHPLLKRFATPAFLRYLLVGGFGFVLDAGGTEILYHLDLDVHAARALAMTGAIFCTYLFHRYYTFTDSRRPQRTSSQFLAFGAVQLTAAALNYAIFCVVLWSQPFFMPAPLPAPWQDFFNIFAIGAGVGAGLVFNFLMLRLLVFQEVQPHERNVPVRESPADRRARKKRTIIQAAIWLIFMAAMLLPAHAREAEVMSFPALHAPLRPADPDVWVRLTDVRQWMRSDDFFDHSIKHTNAPNGGVETPWTRPLDILIRAFYAFTPTTQPIEVRLMLAATWFPPLLAIAALAFMTAGARRMFRHTHVMACAALLWLANADVYDYFATGDSDHHGLLCALWCGVLMLMMSRAMSIGAAVLAGNLLGLMVWISPEALVVTAFVFALMGGEALLKPEKIVLLAAASMGAAAVATLGLFIEAPIAEILTRKTYDALSIVQVALLWLTVFGTTVLAALFQMRLGFAGRFCAAAVTGAVVLLCMYGIFPRFFTGPMADADPFILTNFLPHVAEAEPLFKSVPQDIVRRLMEPLLAALLLALSLCGKPRADRQRQLTLLALLLGGTFIWTLFQVRWDYYFQPVAVIAAAALLPGVAGAARANLCRPLQLAPRGWRPYICIWALIIAVSLFLRAQPVKASESAGCMAQMRYVIETQQLRPLLPGWDVILYVPADIGGDVLFFTPYRIIASNYHREGAGLRDLKRIETAPTPAAGRAVLKERQVDAMLFCSARYPDNSWLHALDKKLPPWLVPVKGLKFMEMPGPVPVLARVKE